MEPDKISVEYLKDWLNDGGIRSISDDYPDNIYGEINSNEDISIYLEAFNSIEFEVKVSNYLNVNENLLHLLLLIQDIEDDDVFESIKDRIIPNFISFYPLLKKHYDEISSSHDSHIDLLFLKVFAIYESVEGIKIISNEFLKGLKSDNYLWTVILKLIGYERDKLELFLESVDYVSPGKIAKGYIRLAYLELSNTYMFYLEDDDICPESIEGYELLHSHLFNNDAGFKILENYLSSKKSNSFSNAVSATTSIPFLKKEYQNVLLPLSKDHPFVDVSIESAWAGAKIGYLESVDDLIEYASDYHYAMKAIGYLEELDLDDKIPESSKNSFFLALAEISDWLRHPNEFGAYPDDAELFDYRTLYWPPLEEEKDLFLVKYRYNFWNLDGSSEEGIGLVGSVTFALFDVDTIDKSPLEIYAMHCAWELGLEDYEDPSVGLKILSEYNENLFD